MGLSSIVLGVISIASSHLRRRKAKKRAARRRDAALGQEVRVTSSAQSIPLIYGYSATNGIPVWAATNNNFRTTLYNGTLPRAGRLVSTKTDGSRNEFLSQQHVLSLGSGVQVEEMWTDEQKPTARYISGSSWGEVRSDGTASSAASHFLGDRSTATFKGLTYVTTVHKLNRKEPQYSGPPVPTFFCKGIPVRGITRTGTAPNYTYALSARTFSNNAILILLDYMIGAYGPGWSWDNDIDKGAFYDAAQIAGQVVQSETGVAGTVFSGAALYPYGYQFGGSWIGALTGSYATAYSRFGLGARNGLIDNKNKFAAADRQRDLLRYEFNGSLGSDADWQDNLTRVLDVIPGGEIFRTVNGKWKVAVPNSMNTAAQQRVGVIDEDILTSPIEISYPDATERINQLDIEYFNINKDFATDTVTFPQFSSDSNSLYATLRAADADKRLGRKITTPGVADEYHANSWASNTINISRNTLYTFTTRPSGFLYEPGDVLQLKDKLAGVDTHVRVSETVVREDLSVTITAVDFNPNDYGWDSTSFGTVVDQPEVDTSILAPSAVTASFAAASQSVTVTWTPNTEEDITVDSYVVEAQTGDGEPWVTVAETAHGANTATLYPGINAQSVKYRVTAKTSQNGTSDPSVVANVTTQAVTGIEGEQGPKGDTGEQGPKGDPGEDGTDADATLAFKMIQRSGTKPTSSIPNATNTELGRAPIVGDTVVLKYTNGSEVRRYSGTTWFTVDNIFEADTIVADNLAAISADLGTITAGTIDADNVTINNLTVQKISGSVTTIVPGTSAGSLSYTLRGSSASRVITLPTIPADSVPYRPKIDVISTVILGANEMGSAMTVFLQGLPQTTSIPAASLGTNTAATAFIPGFGNQPDTPATITFQNPGIIPNPGDIIEHTSSGTRYRFVSWTGPAAGTVVANITQPSGAHVVGTPLSGAYTRVAGASVTTWQDLGLLHVSAVGSSSVIMATYQPISITASVDALRTSAFQSRLLFVGRGAPAATPPTNKTHTTTTFGVANTTLTMIKAR